MTFRRYTKRNDAGKRRECLLSIVYRNMRGRAHGHSTKAPWCYVPGWPWATYAEFRAWALESGFSKSTPSPDRQRTDEPYGPNNVVWRTVRENQGGAAGKGWYNHDAVRGPEPPLPETFREWRRRQRTGLALGAPSADVPF